jgi:dihydrofolate reductase
MRKTVLAMMISLDGYIEGPNKEFVPPAWSDDLSKYWADGNVDNADVMMYGRVCYEGMAAYWPAAEADTNSPPEQREFARKINQKPKLVFSKTLETADWNNTRLVRDNIPNEIAKLKQEGDDELVLIGGADIANTFMKHDLIDEYRLLVTPIVLGGGTPLFKGGIDRFNLKLIEARTLDTGAMILRYAPEKQEPK